MLKLQRSWYLTSHSHQLHHITNYIFVSHEVPTLKGCCLSCMASSLANTNEFRISQQLLDRSKIHQIHCPVSSNRQKRMMMEEAKNEPAEVICTQSTLLVCSLTLSCKLCFEYVNHYTQENQRNEVLDISF